MKLNCDVFYAGDVWAVWLNSFTNVRTTQVFSLLADGVVGIIYTIISTVLQVLIIKAMSKLSKVSAKLSPTSEFREYYAGYFVPAGVQVRTLTCSAERTFAMKGWQSPYSLGHFPRHAWRRTDRLE